MTTWTIEFYEDGNGQRPVEAWMDSTGDVQIGALAAAVDEVLAKQGLDLASTPWLKALGEGPYEFRVQHDEATIRALYTDSGAQPPTKPAKLPLRLFVHFHGQKVTLVLHGYGKGKGDSPRRQNREIQEAASDCGRGAPRKYGRRNGRAEAIVRMGFCPYTRG